MVISQHLQVEHPAHRYTAWSTPDDRERAKQAGFDLLVAKPTEPAELVRLLKIGTNLLKG